MLRPEIRYSGFVKHNEHFAPFFSAVRYDLVLPVWNPLWVQSCLNSSWCVFKKVLKILFWDFGPYWHLSAAPPWWKSAIPLPDRDLVNMEAIGRHYGHKGMDMASNNIQIGSGVQAILQTIANQRLIELLSPLTSDIKKPLLFTQLLLSRFLSLLLRPLSRNPREDGVQKPQQISNFSNT